MFIDDYRYEEGQAPFDVEDGDHAVVIRSAQVETSKNGNRMIKVLLDVPDGNGGVFTHYIVEGEFFNGKMSRFFDAFAITPGNFSFDSWRRKGGNAHFEHEEQTDGSGNVRKFAKIRYFVPKKANESGADGWQGAAPQRPEESRDYIAPAEMKGGAATPEEKAEINRLLSSRYANGTPVFTEKEKQLYSAYRREMTAQELIDFIKRALRNRLGGNALSDGTGVQDIVF